MTPGISTSRPGARRAWTAIDRLAAVASIPAGAAGAYLGLLSLASRPTKRSAGDRSVRFAIVVPAYNEAGHIAVTVKSLLALDYPVEHRRVVVVADNCTDDTAARARTAGAVVIERVDATRRGKGYALTDAFVEVLRDPWVDAIAVVDADTVVSANFLSACASRFAEGEHAAQVEYRVANADASWRTELMAIAFACFHDVRSIGREHFGLSSGLRGNGMAFTRTALERVPHRAASLTEDLEHGIALGEHRIRVAYVHEAHVEADMPVDASTSASQRERWERGRAALRRSHGWPLVRDGIRRRDRVRVDLGADLLLPPLADVAKATAASALAAAVVRVGRGRFGWSVVPAAVAVGGLSGHVAMGWHRSGTGRAGLVAVLRVPGYIRWKATLAGRKPASDGSLRSDGGSPAGSPAGPAGNDAEWVRTARPGEGIHAGMPGSFSVSTEMPMQDSPGTALSTGLR